MSRRWMVLLVCAFGPTLASPAAARAGDEAPAGTRYALLIGVNRYENRAKLGQPDLVYADKDARRLAQTLATVGFDPENLVVLTTARPADDRLCPRAANLRAELKALVRRCTPKDTLLVAYAGYERQFPDSDDYFLCPTDADATDRSTLLGLNEIYALLENCKAGTKVLLIDACRGREKTLRNPPDGVAVFFATSIRELAYEDAKVQGVFTHFVNEGLKGAADADRDGAVTLTELIRYVRPRVMEHTRAEHRASQRPELLGSAPAAPLVVLPRRS